MIRRPTLGRQLMQSLGLMVLASILIGAGSILAINGLHEDFSVAVQGYRQLRQLYDTGFVVSQARQAITASPPQNQNAILALRAALNSLQNRSSPDSVDSAPAQWVDESARSDCQALIEKSIEELNRGSLPSLNLLFARLSDTSQQVRQSISRAQLAADRRQQVARNTIAGLCGFVLIGALLIGARQYRKVMRPIHSISAGVRAFSGGDFDRRIDFTGNQTFAAEFDSLAGDFNKMATELQSLYRDLEKKVSDKTGDLVRAERLAAVGYLAAGVAHEINNPLGIIAGYAERALGQLRADDREDKAPGHREAAAEKTLSVICEEAFRCKQIIERLLTLARPSSQQRSIVSIATIAETVVSTVSGWEKAATLQLIIEPGSMHRVLADELEIKQVLLNLLINAIEAAPQNAGAIQVTVARIGDKVSLSVRDNGMGMTVETQQRIFQPFYSEKRGQRPGTGLGLAIAQAIASDHRGSIVAHSDGLGLGSRFELILPAAIEAVIEDE